MVIGIGKKLDVRKAALLVIEYFKSIHKPFGLVGFRIKSVKPNKENDMYIVECALFPSLSSKLTSYCVKVGIKTKKIISVKEIPS